MKRHYIPNQTTAPCEPNPGPNMLKNREAKLADLRRVLADCRFIPAPEYAAGKRFPKRKPQ